MKRDWDLIRAILTAVEAQPPNAQFQLSNIKGWDEPTVLEHTALLVDSGYLTGRALRDGAKIAIIVVAGLTMTGHDLLDTMRSDSLWGKIKAEAKAKGIELSFDAIKALAKFALGQILGGG